MRANYVANNYKEVIWLLGDGRSGTTWIADLINHEKNYREMFEPFHPSLVKEMSFMLPQQYMRPHDSDDRLEKVSGDVFSGKFTHYVVDVANRPSIYNGLLIKDIFANLFSYWASLRFSNLKIIFLIRHPFAVALSKSKKKDWFWLTNPLDLLSQGNLYEDYLYQFEDVIQETSRKGDYVLSQILIWSIINYVPLRQFNPGQIYVVFYEEAYMDPSREISKIFQFIRPEAENPQITFDGKAVKRPSRFSGKESNLLAGKSPVTSWKDELTPQQIDAGLKILECFGFDELYDDDSEPNWQVLRDLHEKTS
ncbi:MAG: sulfotransferase domain-containing protein [Methylococcaceae bacterium]|nr:sulfotransferase domain-containing protein [Methylococcaceae bacterium]